MKLDALDGHLDDAEDSLGGFPRSLLNASVNFLWHDERHDGDAVGHGQSGLDTLLLLCSFKDLVVHYLKDEVRLVELCVLLSGAHKTVQAIAGEELRQCLRFSLHIIYFCR